MADEVVWRFCAVLQCSDGGCVSVPTGAGITPSVPANSESPLQGESSRQSVSAEGLCLISSFSSSLGIFSVCSSDVLLLVPPTVHVFVVFFLCFCHVLNSTQVRTPSPAAHSAFTALALALCC